MFSPPRREKAREDPPHLPEGECRYILLHPEVTGTRCACVGFALNRAIPGSTCECGHQACYHSPEKAAGTVERHELEVLRARVCLLEQELDQERNGGRASLIDRLGRLEELVDKNRAETETEFKTVYRGMGGLWQNVGILTKRMPYHDDHIERLADEVHRIDSRLIEVDDASIRVEERVDVLETSASSTDKAVGRRRKASTPPFDEMLDPAPNVAEGENESGYLDDIDNGLASHNLTAHESLCIQSLRERIPSVESDSPSWTVHVSLLPTSRQPFPFEKDTAAYKRCLSRGLHQMIVIPDSDSTSFKTAVDEAFSNVLRGREWQPLVARICDAKNLRGLPMLRQLPDPLDCDYDWEFLQKNCAVVDDSGKILDLYIVMSEDTLTWEEIRHVAPFKPGLEDSWVHDPLLDGPCVEPDGLTAVALSQDAIDKRPAAGDIVPTWSPSLKRSASEISRTPSFGSSADGEVARAKIRRQCANATVEVVGRRAEAV
ncbi:Uncharacterized protein BP5553_03624 [Venustampulla echinocandica]|uniref:Uncharacterized protein n=1 Tax=Venustampulla echinocandica TaxID=2656787 RepID=A0A370TUT4_9HELO|nr:Uncharacterized protein BP5553_03624 [Venustampulla echinocandica]RDL39284.1 Uncharacterized protein BP5553_03624 [Venustampulla echinocandica]